MKVLQSNLLVGAIRTRENGMQLEISGTEKANSLTTVQKDCVILNKDNIPEWLHDYVIEIDGKRYVVRKLTPKECWRLFGYFDKQFEKAKTALEEKHYNGKDKASSQLYKQAGNTIVVPMLEAVFDKIKGIDKDW